jgi:ornithine carbamoyltransferase
VCQVCAK